MQNIPMLWVSAAPSIVTCWDVSTMQKDSFFFNMHSTERANVKTVSIAFWKVRQGRFFAWGRLCISNRPRRLKYTRNLCYTDKLKSVFFHFFLNCSRYLPVSVCPTMSTCLYFSLFIYMCVFMCVSICHFLCLIPIPHLSSFLPVFIKVAVKVPGMWQSHVIASDQSQFHVLGIMLKKQNVLGFVSVQCSFREWRFRGVGL